MYLIISNLFLLKIILQQNFWMGLELHSQLKDTHLIGNVFMYFFWVCYTGKISGKAHHHSASILI